MLRGVNAVQKEHLRERAACKRAALSSRVPVPYCTGTVAQYSLGLFYPGRNIKFQLHNCQRALGLIPGAS